MIEEGTPDASAERVARNDATFRKANESIERHAIELGFEGRVPFICECADRSCTAVVPLALAEYEQIRDVPTHFLNLPGHVEAAGPHAQVVDRREGYVIVEKLGRAADIARNLDTRRKPSG
jgi:hypothetical protein